MGMGMRMRKEKGEMLIEDSPTLQSTIHTQQQMVSGIPTAVGYSVNHLIQG